MSFRKDCHESRSQAIPRPGNKPSINLHENVLKGLKASIFEKPNKLQLQVLPHFLNSYEPNLVICSSSRSGKTVCAIIGILDQLSKSLNKYNSAILLAPTYEIAEANFAYAEMLAQFCHISLHFTARDKSSVKGDKSDIFVGTPERTIEFCRSSSVDFKKVGYLLVDEADCLSNPKKYFRDIARMYLNLSSKCRTIVCTSSMNVAIQEFLDKHIKYYKLFELEIDGCWNVYTKQLFLVCEDEEKINALVYLLTMKFYKGKTVVFCERKDVIASLSATLISKEITAGVLSGELTVPQRRSVLEKFKDGSLDILITTRSFMNVIDASDITKLINYDQVLNEKYNVDNNTYKKRQCILSKTRDSLSVNFIEKRWESHVFRTKDIIEGRTYYTGIEIIGSHKLQTYF